MQGHCKPNQVSSYWNKNNGNNVNVKTPLEWPQTDEMMYMLESNCRILSLAKLYQFVLVTKSVANWFPPRSVYSTILLELAF